MSVLIYFYHRQNINIFRCQIIHDKEIQLILLNEKSGQGNSLNSCLKTNCFRSRTELYIIIDYQLVIIRSWFQWEHNCCKSVKGLTLSKCAPPGVFVLFKERVLSGLFIFQLWLCRRLHWADMHWLFLREVLPKRYVQTSVLWSSVESQSLRDLATLPWHWHWCLFDLLLFPILI